MSAKPRPARRQLFPEKLWDLVNKPASGVQWSPDGKKIEVERSQLEKFIGTKFRSHNFDSFIRQLHFYGFRKCGNSYHHDKFQRGQPERLVTMKRKYSNLTLGPMCSGASSQSPTYTGTASSNDSTASGSSSCGSSAGSSSGSSVGCISCSQTADASQTGGAIDLSGGGTKLFVSREVKSSTIDNEHAIDYSSRSLRKVATSPGKSLSKQTYQRPAESKEITLYTMRPIESEYSSYQSTVSNAISSFTDVRQDSVKARSANSSIKISIPEIMRDTNDTVWPKTLVLDNYWNGRHNILSAYFIYKTNQPRPYNQ